jgi:elongation factor G
MIGSAYKNKGIQPLIDAVINYLPSPVERENIALNREDNEAPVKLECDSAKPAVALVFKLEDGRYGQLSYIRMYQGRIVKGIEIMNSRNGKGIRVGRLVRMHSDSMEEISEAESGDIVAIFGADCASGDTLCGNGIEYSMTSMHVPEPVISLALTPKDRKSSDAMSKALNRFTKEDPTFRSYVDQESRQIIVKGMGELHLDVYIERMKREYGVAVDSGAPQVAYRETISEHVEFDYTHKKQTGGSGQYARVAGIMQPYSEGDYLFEDQIKGGSIPAEYIPSCDKGFKACLEKGSLIGFPIVGVKLIINDGAYHPVDSSDQAFQLAAIGAFRNAYNRAKPHILEPIMTVAVESPAEFLGSVLATINQRRGMIVSTTEDTNFVRVEATVPLGEMFGYSSVLRSVTQGKAEFTMEFARYSKVPMSLAEKLQEEFKEKSKERS